MDVRYKENWNTSLKNKRLESNYTQEEISKICGTYKSRWSLYESGEAYPNEIEWQKIFHYLKSTPFDFFDYSEIDENEYKLLELTHGLIHKFRENKSQTLLNKYIKFSIIEIEHLFEKKREADGDWII